MLWPVLNDYWTCSSSRVPLPSGTVSDLKTLAKLSPCPSVCLSRSAACVLFSSLVALCSFLPPGLPRALSGIWGNSGSCHTNTTNSWKLIQSIVNLKPKLPWGQPHAVDNCLFFGGRSVNHRQTDRQKDRQAGKQTDRQTDRMFRRNICRAHIGTFEGLLSTEAGSGHKTDRIAFCLDPIRYARCKIDAAMKIVWVAYTAGWNVSKHVCVLLSSILNFRLLSLLLRVLE